MKKYILTICFFLGALINLSAKDLIHKQISKGVAIEKIDVSSIIDVEIYKSSDFRVELYATENIINQVNHTIIGNSIILSLKSGRFQNNEKVIVKIYTDEFTNIDSKSSSDVYIKGNFTLNSMVLKSSGSSDIKFEQDIVVNGDVNISAESSSDIHLLNITSNGSLAIATSGSADVKGLNLKTNKSLNIVASSSSNVYFSSTNTLQNSNIVCSGSSDCSLGQFNIKDNLNIVANSSSDFKATQTKVGSNVNLVGSGSSSIEILSLNANGIFQASLSSSSDLEIENGGIILTEEYNKISTSGSSTFKCPNLKLTKAEISCTSSSQIIINVSDEITFGDVSSMGDIRYIGNPIFKNMPGNVSIKKY